MAARRVLWGLGVVVAALGAGVLVGAGPAVAADPSVTWTTTDRLGRTEAGVGADCPTASECWAVEAGVLVSSTDVGAHWTHRSDLLPASAQAVGDVACPAAGSCRVTADTPQGAQLVVVDGGRAVARTIPGGTHGLRIDCPSLTACVATDGTAVFSTADAGRTWRAGTLARSVYDVAISCGAGSSTCLVTGHLYGRFAPTSLQRSLDGGVTWSPRALPGFLDVDADLLDVDCLTGTSCRVVGGSDGLLVMTTGDAGGTWRRNVTPRIPGVLRALSCADQLVCRAVGTGADQERLSLSTTDGRTWTKDAMPAGSLTPAVDIACAAGRRCVVVMTGTQLRATVPTGSWVEEPLPQSFYRSTGIDCPTVALCIGVGQDHRSGASLLRGVPGAWSVTPLPASMVPAAVDCVTASTCVTVGNGVWRSTDAGATWRREPLALGPYLATSVACPTTSVCLAALDRTLTHTAAFARTVDGGVTWDRLPAPAGAYELADLSCSAATSCVAVGFAAGGATAWRTADAGATWGATVLGADARSEAVACWSAVCVATVDGGGAAPFARSTDRGRTWTPVTAPATDRISTLACAPTGRCVAGGFQLRAPLVSTDGGMTWRADRLPGTRGTGTLGCLADRCFTVTTPFDGGPVVIAEPVAD